MPPDTTPTKDEGQRPLPPRIYEHVVTRAIAERVSHTPPGRVSKRPLDPADPHRSARHVDELARRALYSVRGDDAAAVERQVQMASAIA